jgi:hypothetical protein
MALKLKSQPNHIIAELDRAAVDKAKRKFLRLFPGGFTDETYIAWERDYKWQAYLQWQEQLKRAQFLRLLLAKRFAEVATIAVRIESPRPLLFSYEKMALRDAVRETIGARRFATGLFEFLHGKGDLETRFGRWCETIGELPRPGTRVLTWPLVTVFGFIAQPDRHIFLKPNTTKEAARKLGFDFQYASQPNWATYRNYLEFAEVTRAALVDMKPRDMIDIQSFLWVQGADEYS